MKARQILCVDDREVRMGLRRIERLKTYAVYSLRILFGPGDMTRMTGEKPACEPLYKLHTIVRPNIIIP